MFTIACFPQKKNGSANKEIIDIANKIKNILMQHNINIKLIATDCDTKYNSKSQQTFSKYIGEFIQNGFLSAIQKVENSEETFWISDFLHLLKLARKQFIKGPITIRNTIKHVFTNKSLEDDLKLGAPLIDTTSLSNMKDFYVIKIFTLKEKKNDESIYLLPFALWQESLMSKTLKKSTRLLFLEIAFQIFYHFYYQLKYSKFEKGITVYKSKYSKALYFNNENFLIRCMNTTLFTYSSIHKYESVCLHRIGSHPIENYFGNIRFICRNYDNFENFVRAAIQTFTNMIIKSKFQIIQKVKNRINIAGINLKSATKPPNFFNYPLTFFHLIYSPKNVKFQFF